VALIKTLGLTELVSDALAIRKHTEAETNAKIVDLFKEALDEIKNCRTEQQRVEKKSWCGTMTPEDPVIPIFAGCLANHDRAHSLVCASLASSNFT